MNVCTPFVTMSLVKQLTKKKDSYVKKTTLKKKKNRFFFKMPKLVVTERL